MLQSLCRSKPAAGLTRRVQGLVCQQRYVSATSGTSTVDSSEINKFSGWANSWWNESSPEFQALHSLNRVRVPLIKDAVIASNLSIQTNLGTRPLAGLTILDIGCGGGILSEVTQATTFRF